MTYWAFLWQVCWPRPTVFHGVNQWGGAFGQETVFHLAAKGGFAKLLDLIPSLAYCPEATLMQYAAGPPFYGSTYTGGAFGDGVLYSVIPRNSVAILVIEGPIDIPLT